MREYLKEDVETPRVTPLLEAGWAHCSERVVVVVGAQQEPKRGFMPGPA